MAPEPVVEPQAKPAREPQPKIAPPPVERTGPDLTIPKRRAAAEEAPAPAEAAPAEPPASSITVAEPPPKQADLDKAREEGKTLGKAKSKEKVVSGKPLDPKTAKPNFVTDKRPFSLDDLRRQQMKELEDIMDEMRGKIDHKRKSGGGAGLW